MPLRAADVAAARLPFGRAATLPSNAYTDPSVYAAEVERIFRREWLCVARADQIANAGDYLCVDLLGDRLVVTRDERGEIHVLSRVCRHRGAVLLEGRGNAKTLRCPYHAWVYRLDGQLAGAPHMEGASGFEPKRCALPRLACEVWEGFVFTSFDPGAAPLAPGLAGLSRVLARYRLGAFVSASEPMVFESVFDWKVLVDNFMEAYHHIAVHRDTLEPALPARASYALDSDGPWSLLVMPPRDAKPPADPADWPDASLVAGCVFPAHLVAPTREVLTWYQILPEAPGRFTLRIHVCPSPEMLDSPHAEAIRALARQIHLQDIEACEATFAGLGSSDYRAGLIAPLERPLWQFAQWWLDRMGL
jgi:phenylpropionate dioxygenase-like ring-hydroxylating dioxygenase large terminal subunit